MCTTLIVPGLNGSDEGHWQRHWLLDDPQAQLVDQEDWHCPVLD
ncbi:alpha/beta hydrolase, partial [Rhizobium sp. BR5]